jgi:hypothetical protein
VVVVVTLEEGERASLDKALNLHRSMASWCEDERGLGGTSHDGGVGGRSGLEQVECVGLYRGWCWPRTTRND